MEKKKHVPKRLVRERIIAYIALHSGETIRAIDIGAHVGISRSSAHKIVSRMAQEGVICREAVMSTDCGCIRYRYTLPGKK